MRILIAKNRNLQNETVPSGMTDGKKQMNDHMAYMKYFAVI